MKKRKLLFFIATDAAFCSHRLNLGKTALKAGFKVAVVTRCNQHQDVIRDAGIQLFPLYHLTRSGLNPVEQWRALLELYRIYQHYKPDVVHHVAMKPVVFGSLVAWWCKVPKVINALGGLGYLFTGKGFKKSLLRQIVTLLFKFIFSRPNNSLILQNSDDLQVLQNAGCIDTKRVVLIRGAGVDPNAFPIATFPLDPPVTIACITRMLRDKGIFELVEAAKILKRKEINATVLLYGTPDAENPSSIEENQIQAWHDAGIIVWKKHCDNVATAYANCHIAVLPSYREGLPKSLLEAASCGRPIVTTDVAGCREVVVNGENGLLVPVKNSTHLAESLIALCADKALREKMGKAGRARVEQYFTDSMINAETLKLY